VSGEHPAAASRILVVDDNEDLRDNLAEVLGAEGYRVIQAADCASAAAAAAEGFEVALVDVRLPDGDGTDLAARLVAAHPDAEVVMLTGFATIETATAAVRSGAFAYLVKPCAPPDLLLTVEQAMRQVRLRAEKRELSRRAQVNEKLAAIGTLTAGLSHEIRNPLNAAGLQLQVLERQIRKLEAQLQPPLLSPLRLVQEEIQRLENILQDFLQFARPRRLEPKPTSLQTIVARVLDLLDENARRRNVEIGRHLEEATVLADGDQLHQVILNLCLNAIEAMPHGGRLDIATAATPREVIITVDDDGPGIPEDIVGRLFEPFFTTKATGSGLGLPIAHAIVGQHGGTIDVKRLQDRGTRFEIRLPLVATA